MNRCASAVSEPCSLQFPVRRSECCMGTSKHSMLFWNGDDAQKHLASDPVTHFTQLKLLHKLWKGRKDTCKPIWSRLHESWQPEVEFSNAKLTTGSVHSPSFCVQLAPSTCLKNNPAAPERIHKEFSVKMIVIQQNSILLHYVSCLMISSWCWPTFDVTKLYTTRRLQWDIYRLFRNPALIDSQSVRACQNDWCCKESLL